MKHMIILLFCLLTESAIAAGIGATRNKFSRYPSDWKSHLIKTVSSRSDKLYQLEVIEFLNKSKINAPILLFIPGYFQNAYSWDLLPEKGISIVDYIDKNYNFHMFSLQPNGIGNSDYIKKSNIDDIAIDDIPNGINYLRNKFKKDVYVLGHSNGAISLQASMAGLKREDGGNVFDPLMAHLRQLSIKGIGLSAGNVCMSDGSKETQLYKLAKLGRKIRGLNNNLGWVNAKILTKFLSPTKGLFGKKSAAYLKVWEFLYHIPNVTREAREALYSRTVEGTSSPSLNQYSAGVVDGCIKNTSGEFYNSGLVNIQIPTYQLTYELDPMAVPEFTERDSFSQIGSFQKELITFPGQGHEDFMMNPKYHTNLKWLLDRFTGLK